MCIIIEMAKQVLLLALLVSLAIITNSQFSKCPNLNPLLIASDSLTVSSSGSVALQSGVDIQCYNYTLANPFNCTPGVAIAVNNFQSATSNNLFFSIKAINSDSNGVIPFVVRTQWGYTRWSRITFSFIAEATPQINAGYYQIDTATLSACFSGKTIIAFVPLTSCTINKPKALTFLNGFEISSVSVNASYLSPFEVQVISNSVSQQGITLVLSSTSATQIHSLFVSYVVYDPFIQNLVAGSYVYNQYAPVNSLSHTPPIGVTNNNVAFHGFNGFVIANPNLPLAFGGQLSNGNISISSTSTLYYLSYNYFFLIGGPCGQCVGFNINYNNNCVATCPPSSYYNGVTCVVCLAGQVWNGTACVVIPVVVPVVPTNTNGSTGNSGSGSSSSSSSSVSISCPAGTYWDGQQLRCLPCVVGCATCVDCDSCRTCRLGFFFPQNNPFCSQICGDGRKFVLPCDDGNAVNGDGCSSTCQVEAGWNCNGGSSVARDVCVNNIPNILTFTSKGQSHIYGKIIINVGANYLPQSLLQSGSDCRDNCKNILLVRFTSGDSSASSIVASYIPNSEYNFSIEISYGREPIGIFSVQISLNPAIANKYFAGINTSATLNVNVNPALFAVQPPANNNNIA